MPDRGQHQPRRRADLPHSGARSGTTAQSSAPARRWFCYEREAGRWLAGSAAIAAYNPMPGSQSRTCHLRACALLSAAPRRALPGRPLAGKALAPGYGCLRVAKPCTRAARPRVARKVQATRAKNRRRRGPARNPDCQIRSARLGFAIMTASHLRGRCLSGQVRSMVPDLGFRTVSTAGLFGFNRFRPPHPCYSCRRPTPP